MKHQFQGAVFARMSSNRGVMIELDNIAIKLFIIRDIKFFLVMNESILFFPFKETV
jgi:hypothetical protein